MMTIVKSPRRRLEEELNITGGSRGLRVSDHLAFSCGDKVVCIEDPRHVGEVRAISSSVYVTVMWLETKWRSVVHVKKLRRAEEE